MTAVKNTKSTLSKMTATAGSSSSSLQIPSAAQTDPSATPVQSQADTAAQAKAAAAAVKKQDLQFSCWDFGGQEVYYTTHSFFLTERSIFLVVFNLALGANNCRVEYWLNSIKSRAPKASVVLVGTHLDDPLVGGPEKAAAEMDALFQKYKRPFRVKCALAVSTNLSKRENIVELLDKLVEAARAEPLLRGRVPTSYCALSLFRRRELF